MRYWTKNEGTGYRGKDHDQPITILARCFTMPSQNINLYHL